MCISRECPIVYRWTFEEDMLVSHKRTNGHAILLCLSLVCPSRYVGNSPTNATDPSGLFADDDEFTRVTDWWGQEYEVRNNWFGIGAGVVGANVFWGPLGGGPRVNPSPRGPTILDLEGSRQARHNFQFQAGKGQTGNSRGAPDIPDPELTAMSTLAAANVEFYGVATGMASPMGGAGGISGATTGKVLDDWADDAFQVIKHGSNRPRPVGSQSHHGVMSAWMRSQSSKYNADLAPAILMSRSNHQKTFGVFNKWYAEQSKAMGGKFDWKNVTEFDIRALSEHMFDASSVPGNIRQEYWEWFERMKKALAQ